MSCLKTSEAGAKNVLRNKGLIDPYLGILDLGKFRAEVSSMSNYASVKYGVTERLFTDDGFKAIPNTAAFQIIDWKKGIKYPENEWVGKGFIETSPFEITEVTKENSKLYAELLELTTPEEAERLWLQTKSPEFKAWFKNSAVVDENGEPLIVYHGTDVNFEYFDKNKTGEFHSAGGELGRGFYFTKDLDYINNVMGSSITLPVFLSIQNPYIIKRILVKEGTDILFSAEYSTNLEKDYNFNLPKEYDGIIGDDRLQQVVVFEPNQIKSIFNTGTFSTDKNIYYQQRTISPKKITPQVKEQLIGFLKEVNPNFRVEVIDNLSGNGVANTAEFLIQLKKGKEDLALAEETAHVFLELLNDPKLKKDLLSDVVRTKMYKRVVEEYGQLYGMDYSKLKREAAAKLISLWIQDRDAFNYWSGSEQLNSNLGGLISRLIDWLKRVMSPYSTAALRILKGDTQGIDTALASYSEVFYQIDPSKFQTVGDDLSNYDKVFINLNNTLLNYKDYQQPDVVHNGVSKSGKVIKSLFFSDAGLREELNQYYQLAPLTKLGRELKDKVKLLNPRRIVVFTDAPITDAMVTRIEGEFGPVTIRRTGFNTVETFEDEFGNPVDRIISGSEKNEFILGQVEANPNQNILFIDNQSTSLFSENRPNLSLKFYSNDVATYTDEETLRRQREIRDNNKKFSEGVVKELSQINKDSLLPLVDQSMKMVRNAIGKLKNEELSKIFKDEFGNTTLPLDKAPLIKRLLDNTDTFEKGLLNFVQTIESTRYFFKKANENRYEALKDLIEQDTPESIDQAIREAAVLLRMILSWEEWVKGVQPYLTGTQILKGVISEFSGELREAQDQLNKLSVEVLSKSLAEQWKPHNDTLKQQLDRGLISREDYERRIYTSQKLVDWLVGKEGDIATASAWFENPLLVNDPILQAISRKIEIETIGAEKQYMDESIKVSQELWDLGEKVGMTDEQIGERLTYVDQTNQWEDGEMVQKPTLTYLNPWQNTWVLQAKKQEVRKLYEKYNQVRNTDQEEAVKLELDNAKQELDLWIQANWYDEVTPEGKNVYKEFGIEDDIFELAKERQKEIYDQMAEYTDTLQQIYITEEQEERANKELESLVRELRLLRNEYTVDGELKTGDDLLVAQKLRQKSLIDRQIYDYELNKKLFLDSIKEQIVSISDESVKTTLLTLLNTDNLLELKNYADQYAPQSFIDWLDRNTRTKLSDDFYEKRKEIIEQIKQLSNNPQVETIWGELTNLTSFLRDKDLTFDASDSTPDIQEKVKQFEVILESLKGETNLEIIPLIQQLSELQGKAPTEFYNQVMYDWLKDIYPGISSSTNYNWLINQSEFKKFLNTDQAFEFKQWFDRNHFVKQVWDETTKTKEPMFVSTYIWKKTVPTNPNDVVVTPGWKYNKRILKDSATVELGDIKKDLILKTPKIDWVTWNPVERNWLPKSQAFRNEEYFRLKNSKDEKDKLLFEYLTKLTDYSSKVQIEGNRDSVLGFTVPYYHKKYTEGGAIRTAVKALTNRINPREEEAETPNETKSLKQRLRTFAGIETVEQEEKTIRTDYLGNKFKTVYTPYTTWLDPKDVSKNLVLSTTNYANGVYKIKALVSELPQLNLLEQVFNEFLPKEKGTLNQFGQMIDAGTNNRLKVLENVKNTKLYSDFKQMELGRGVDRFLVGIRKIAGIGSQSDLNLPNAVKNWMQGQLMNLVFSKDGGWATRKSLFKAMKDFKTSYANYLVQMGSKEKSIDYYILSFFNPLLERRTQDFSRSGVNNELNDRALFYSSTASEFSVFSTLLYAHLYNQPVTIDGKEAKLYDAFYLSEQGLEIKPNTILDGREINTDYIQDLKLRYKLMMENVGGKQWNETISQRYSVWQSLEFFKKFFVPMFRRRFFTSRENIELGMTEGSYITAFKYVTRMLLGFIDGTKYNQALSPEEQRNLAAARDEILLGIATLVIISYLFGFDEDDKDKYKKLKDRSWLENMALLLAINTKRETDALLPVPFISIQNSIYPPILNETYSFITNPFVGFQVINEGRKMLDSLILLGLGSDKAYYESDMPAYLIEKGDSKFVHYMEKFIQIDNFLYQAKPAEKIQVIVGSQNK